ncbi:hypothetical protein [Paraburkholderia sp.]|uniref:hypothetical protein n=1 Tax=Paraburkholderia sp. TaxID=1926495 RepID=UPI002394A7BB|nr:hypothetical protein [Paraburkholderia sp.]MDE1183261.1 hypothetical protein [Paraburkholderia sp.]
MIRLQARHGHHPDRPGKRESGVDGWATLSQTGWTQRQHHSYFSARPTADSYGNGATSYLYARDFAPVFPAALPDGSSRG